MISYKIVGGQTKLRKVEYILHYFLQFNAFMSIIHEMISKVESEHKAKLEQLDSLQQEQRYSFSKQFY